MQDMPSFQEIQKKLGDVTNEMLVIIQKYGLDADSPFDVIRMAREKITDDADYIRFLELSLEGRIYADAGDALKKAEDAALNAQSH